MACFRKKPVVIEAVQVNATDFNGQSFDGNPFNEPAPGWLVEALKSGAVVPDTPGSTDYAEWKIPTLEGDMLAKPGDWIIRGIKGELYPCKPDIFQEIYEPSSVASDADRSAFPCGHGELRAYVFDSEHVSVNVNSVQRLFEDYDRAVEAVRQLLPEGWGDDATMDHMPGVRLARQVLAAAGVEPRACELGESA